MGFTFDKERREFFGDGWCLIPKQEIKGARWVYNFVMGEYGTNFEELYAVVERDVNCGIYWSCSSLEFVKTQLEKTGVQLVCNCRDDGLVQVKNLFIKELLDTAISKLPALKAWVFAGSPTALFSLVSTISNKKSAII